MWPGDTWIPVPNNADWFRDDSRIVPIDCRLAPKDWAHWKNKIIFFREIGKRLSFYFYISFEIRIQINIVLLLLMFRGFCFHEKTKKI